MVYAVIIMQTMEEAQAIEDQNPPKKMKTKNGKVTLWLSFDPETFRVAAQEQEFLDGDFPKGLRGVGWKTCQIEVDEKIWNEMLRGELSEDEQDEYHRQWWSEGYGKTWPEV